MSKFRASYDFEIDPGNNIPPNAIAEFILLADRAKSDYNLWELSNPVLVNVEVLDD